MTRLNLAFLGVTHPHAAAWADAAVGESRTTITRVFDRDRRHADRFAHTYGAAAETSAAEALRGVDAVVVDGRNDEAPAFARQAVRAGLPVLIEKTGARTAGELKDVAAAAEAASVVTHMGYFMRYADSVRTARTAIQEGTLGDLLLARFHAEIPASAWVSMREWFSDGTNVVTPFMEAGCHLIDVIRHLLGDPGSVQALAVRRSSSLSPGEDAIAAVMTCGHTLVTVDFTSRGADPWNLRWGGELYGDRQSLSFGLLPARTAWGGEHARSWEAAVPLDAADAVQARSAHENRELMSRGMSAFVDAVEGRRPSPVDARNGAQTLKLIETILDAAASESAGPARIERDS